VARFPEGETLDAASLDVHSYLRALDCCFHTDRSPYMRWFGIAFGAVPQGLDASYAEGSANTAVDTHLCSPVATEPTWSMGFPRPIVTLEGLITPSLRQGQKFTVLTDANLEAAWRSVTDQVLAHELVLATGFDMPPVEATTALMRGGRERC
jgi:hypothetical protein